MKRNMKRRGFTLVELLIVIVVIGILSAMMMLSSTEAVTSAKASNIVSNLRNLKTAALAMYVDSMDAFDQRTNEAKTRVSDIKYVVKYMNGGDGFETTGYSITSNDVGWFLSYKISGTTTEKTQIEQKLKGRAKSVGLLKDAAVASSTNVYDGGDTVYYFVR